MTAGASGCPGAEEPEPEGGESHLPQESPKAGGRAGRRGRLRMTGDLVQRVLRQKASFTRHTGSRAPGTTASGGREGHLVKVLLAGPPRGLLAGRPRRMSPESKRPWGSVLSPPVRVGAPVQRETGCRAQAGTALLG